MTSNWQIFLQLLGCCAKMTQHIGGSNTSTNMGWFLQDFIDIQSYKNIVGGVKWYSYHIEFSKNKFSEKEAIEYCSQWYNTSTLGTEYLFTK